MDVAADALPTTGSPETHGTAVVEPHTHWDREWSAPFETIRFHLVRFFDELLDVVAADPDLTTSLLDGQSVPHRRAAASVAVVHLKATAGEITTSTSPLAVSWRPSRWSSSSRSCSGRSSVP